VTGSGFLLPRSSQEAVALLAEHGDDLLVLGGGTIVMGMIHDGVIFPGRAMSLARAGLDGITPADGQVTIGATATVARLAALDALPPLAAAARLIGGPALRTTATVGGNLFAPAPAGDLAVPLLALDTQVELIGPRQARALPLETFLAQRAPLDGTSAGHAPDELVVALHVSRPAGKTAYLKLARRVANAASVVSVAVQAITDASGTCLDARIALGAAAPRAVRARAAEHALRGQPFDAACIAAAADAAMEECDPFTDALASAWYRRRMVGVYVRRALESLLAAD
jgi:CO/xanthine dehydrogenase FAD-binding subunit